MNEVKVKWTRYLFRVCFLSLNITLLSWYWSCSLVIDEGHVEIVSEGIILLLFVRVTFVGNSSDDDDTDNTTDDSNDHSSVWWGFATNFPWLISSGLPSIEFFIACVFVSSSLFCSSGSFSCCVAWISSG